MHAVEQSDSDHNMFIGTINVEQEVCIKKIDNAEMEDGDEWTEELKINRRKVKCKLDTGAGCNVMSADTFNSLDIGGKLKKSTCRLVAYFGQQSAPLGKRELTCVHKGQKHKIEFEITQQNVPAILGKKTCKCLVKRVYDIKKDNDILNGFDDLCSGLGCLPGIHHIQIDPTISPVVHAPRKVPVALRDKVVEELHRMEQNGVITRQIEPTDWVSRLDDHRHGDGGHTEKDEDMHGSTGS